MTYRQLQSVSGVLLATACIAFLFAASPAAACPTGGVVGHWPVNGDATDASDCANDGTVSGATLVDDVFGNANSAYTFGGFDSIDFGSDPTLRPALPVSFSAFVRHTCSYGDTCVLFQNDADPTNYTGLAFYVGAGVSGGGNRFGVRQGDGGSPSGVNRRNAETTSPLVPGVWHHVAAVVRGLTDVDVYIDGAPVGVSYVGSGGAMAYAGNPAKLGAADAVWGGFQGDVDQLRLYDRELTPAEISELAVFSRVVGEQKISDTSGYLSNPGSPGSNPGGLLTDADLFGTVTGIGDLDGDGVEDVAVGAHKRDIAGQIHGSIFVLLLNSDGSVKTRVEIGNGVAGLVVAWNDEFGIDLANLGDVDGDSVTDLAVGTHREDTGGGQAGAVHILFLNSNGTLKSSQKITEGVGGGPTLTGGDRFGAAVAALGDLNGDGVPDLAVGADQDSTDGTDIGAVYVLFLKGGVGEPNPGHVLGSPIKITAGQNGFTGPPGGKAFGRSLALLGDLDGDLRPELAVGNYRSEIDLFEAGSVWILSLCTTAAGDAVTGEVCGERDLNRTSESLLADELEFGDRFGTSVAALGDADGDGTPDLAASALWDDDGGSNRGAVYLLYMNPDKTLRRLEKISDLRGGLTATLEDSDGIGWGLAVLGDLANDGTVELAVGAPSDDDGGSARGALHLLSLDFTTTCGDGVPEPTEACDDGNTVAGDGCSDVCVDEFCGDSLIQPGLGENCDDGNAVAEDGCSDLCVAEFCGDGTLQVGLGEACDDGNMIAGDGCSDVCVVEFCGDGVTQAGIGETCDDGNTTAGDGCNEVCIAEVCGDGIVQAGIGEVCDDGNMTPLDGCSDTCQPETTVSVVGTGSGGSIEYTLAGVTVQVTTTGGQTAAQIATALAAAINANGTLSGLGVTAAASGELLIHGDAPTAVDGSETDVAIGTTSDQIFDDTSLIPRTLDFESLLAGASVPDTTSLEGVTFGYTLDGATALATDAFDTESPSNSLGLSGGDDAFLDGDALVFTLPHPVLALGLYVVTSDPAAAGEILLMTPHGASGNSATPDFVTADGGNVYFIGHVAAEVFSSASLDFASDGETNFVYNLDDVTAAVPTDGSCGFSGVAVGGYTVGATVEGVWVQIGTTAGLTAAQVAGALAAAINANASLTGQGIVAIADGDTLLTNGEITSQLNTDPGLGGAPPAIPAAGPLALAALLALLGLAGAIAIRRGNLV